MLKKQILYAIKNDIAIKSRLCTENNCHMRTIENWIEDNSRFLTMYNNLRIIADALNTNIDKILILEKLKS